MTDHDRGLADPDTIARARAKDTDALADLWAIYQPQLLGLLRARRTASAEDIASQVWLDVGRSIDRFEGDGVAFRRWLFTIAGRRVIDERRRAWRRREVPVESVGQLPVRTEPDDRWGWSLEAAQAMLTSLSPATRQVIMLRIVHDMSVPLVAKATGRSEGNVRVLMHRGLRQLRERAVATDAVESKGSIDDQPSGSVAVDASDPDAILDAEIDEFLVAARR